MNTCPIAPIGDRVVIRRDLAPAKTPGGLYLGDRARAREVPSRGTVLAVGPGRTTSDGVVHPVGVEPGEMVYFAAHAGEGFKLDGQEVLVMAAADLLAAVSEGPATAVERP